MVCHPADQTSCQPVHMFVSYPVHLFADLNYQSVNQLIKKLIDQIFNVLVLRHKCQLINKSASQLTQSLWCHSVSYWNMQPVNSLVTRKFSNDSLVLFSNQQVSQSAVQLACGFRTFATISVACKIERVSDSGRISFW